MLSIGKMVARSEDYYLRTVAAGREEYYSGAGEAPGYWLGGGSALLGLCGEVAPGDLRAVLAGVSPHGEILTKAGVAEARRVAGFDLTFSAPKSVSLLYGLSDRGVATTVRAVHADALAQALSYLERHALRVRRDAGGLRHLGAQGLVAAAFLHRTSRAGDPQLHTHVLVANATLGHDGAWSAPDGRLFYIHARAAGAVYQGALRAGLGQALGVAFGPVTRGQAELEGVPRSVRRAFSTRRREIEAVLAATGEHSSRAAEVAALVTRSPKTPGAEPSGPGLRRRWLDRGAEVGLDVSGHPRGPFAALLGQVPWTPPRGAEVDLLVARLLGPEGLTAAASGFERRDVVWSIAGGLARGAELDTLEALAERLLARRDVVTLGSLGRSGERRYTTTELLAVERALLAQSERLGSARRGVVGPVALATGLRRFPLLADEQVAMVRRLVTSGAGVDVVVGKAGAGKTLALAAARRAWESAGLRVLGAALSARAAHALAEGAGLEADTLARLFARISGGSQHLGSRDVIVVDEAGMVGTRQLARLVELTDAAGAKIVLVGDPRQLPEIDAGGTLSALVERLGAIELTENRRQREHWERVALDALRNGRAEVALATYERAGRVHTAPSLAEARADLARAWAASSRAGQGSVMLAVERAEVAALNDLARASLRQGGSLGDDVVKAGGRGFALGDAVVCLRNDRRVGVLNGTTGTLTRRVGAGVVIATTDGERVLPASYLAAGRLDHAYALTVHKAQGLTVERAFVLATSALTQEAGYVAMSRARASTELFVALDGDELGGHDPRPQVPADPLALARRRLATSRAKQLALLEIETSDDEHCNADGGDERSPVTDATCEQGNSHASYRVEHGARGVGDAAMGAQLSNRALVFEAAPCASTAPVDLALERLAELAASAASAAALGHEARRRDSHGRDHGRGR